MSANIFLYRLIGCLDLVRSAGQKKHMLSHAGMTFLETMPIFDTENLLSLQSKLTNPKKI